MSHFSVLVIGDNVEDQLQPYHEYECTGTKDKYVVFVDKHDEVTADWEDKEKAHKQEYENINEFASDYHGYDEIQDGRIGRLTNPNAKWDWWVVGGRWSSWLNITQGKNSQFDWQKTVEKRKSEAVELFDCIEEATAGIDPIGETWEQIRERISDIDLARAYRNSHPWIKAIRNSKKESLRWCDQPEKIHAMGREKYIKQQSDGACVPFAFVKDGNWVEKGDMGWFGCVSDEKDQSDWNSEFNKMMALVSDDTLITVVDCHI